MKYYRRLKITIGRYFLRRPLEATNAGGGAGYGEKQGVNVRLKFEQAPAFPGNLYFRPC